MYVETLRYDKDKTNIKGNELKLIVQTARTKQTL